jgi:hypothetical protein
LQKGTNNGKLKQVGKNAMLIAEKIEDMSGLYEYLQKMQKYGEPAK